MTINPFPHKDLVSVAALSSDQILCIFSTAAALKAERDRYAAMNAQIDYLERVGALVDKAEIAAAIESAVATFWTEFDQALKVDAAEYASELNLDAEQSRKLRTLMIRKNRVLRTNISRAFQDAEARVAPSSAKAA